VRQPENSEVIKQRLQASIERMEKRLESARARLAYMDESSEVPDGEAEDAVKKEE